MNQSQFKLRPVRVARGATIIDVLAGAGCAIALAAMALPLLGAIGSESGEARSNSNLRILAAANDAYSAAFEGRQYTAMPEDAGLVNGNCDQYITTIACPPLLVLGNGPNGTLWGIHLANIGFCVSPANGHCGNWVLYKSFAFSGIGTGLGSFRLPNVRAFNSFVDGKFFSDTFYAPNDRYAMDRTAAYRDAGVDFDSNSSSDFAYSSYCFSPAAMMNPATLAASGYKAQESYAEGFVSPTVATCAHPDLKTRMIEHNWNHRPPSTGSPDLSDEPWYFNSSASASTQSIFFDGHIGRILTSKAVADDASAQASSGTGLWHRGTPLGANGYFGQYSADGTKNSHTILTIDGILGRDVLTAQ